MILKVEPEAFKEVIKSQYSIDHLFLLKLIDEGIDLKEFCEGSERLKVLHFSLKRRALIYEHEDKLTLLGKHLLSFIETEGGSEPIKKNNDEDAFLRWWKQYPPGDEFSYKDKHFAGDRSFKVKKDECRTKLCKILIEGDYNIEELIGALRMEVIKKKEQSYRTGVNKLKYMHNSLTYLNQRDFEGFIEMAKINKEMNISQEEPEEQYNGGIDI